MKLVLATPLYPPDVAEPAPYVKELAARLQETDDVTVIAYGHLPETVTGVRIVTVSKRRPLPIRLIAFTFALLRAARKADILYVQNGPSVELPAALVSLFARAPLIVRIGDKPAHERAKRRPLLGAIERFARKRAREVVTDSPLPRPEILPFAPRPAAAFDAFERSWKGHADALRDTFSHA